MTFTQRLVWSIFLTGLMQAPESFAQNCFNQPQGPGTSRLGFAVQGQNDCFMASDINAGIASGHQISPTAGQSSDRDSSSPDEAMHVLRECLELKGYAKPGAGTSDGKPGFNKALCECNEKIFGKKFVCDSMRFSGEVHAGDLALLQELIENQCIVIAGLGLYLPHGNGGWNEWIGHSVALVGVQTCSGPGSSSITVRDGNNPDQPYTLDIDSNGALKDDDYQRFLSASKMYLVNAVIKCVPSSSEEQQFLH